ncbi:MAG: YbdD/YjiX family protein [Nevskia sp.]|nr:YbdD/YjiX family protein [Nevskia sp.]
MSRPTSLNSQAWLGAVLRRLRQAAHLAVGIPDYEVYVAHRHAHHPGEPLMSYEAFFRERQASRYRRGTTRCC